MNEGLIVTIPNVRIPEHTWIVETMLTTYLGLEVSIETHANSSIVVTNASRTKILELPSILLTAHPTEWDVQSAVPNRVQHWISPSQLPWTMPERDVAIPVLFASNEPRKIETAGNQTTLQWDLFGSAFFMLSRLEEVLQLEVDDHGRFPAANSLAFKEGFERTPVVNAWGEILWEALHDLLPDLKRKQRQYKVVPSHDVDWPLVSNRLPFTNVVKSAAGDVLVRKNAITAIRRILGVYLPQQLRQRVNPGNTFDFIMRVSEQHGLTSAFYFIPENTAGTIDGTYNLNMPFIQDLLKDIHDRGHEIGVHPGYDTFQSPSRIKSGFECLRSAADELGIQQKDWGGRQHYLRWNARETWQHWDAAGLTYDSSVGYAETVGFRTGACFDYPVFDVVNREALGLVERPLVVMEGSLFKTTSTVNLALDDPSGLKVVRQLADAIRAYNGNFTLLWHNSTLITKQQQVLYRATVEQLAI